MFAYRPTSTHCFDLVKAMTLGMTVSSVGMRLLGFPMHWAVVLNLIVGNALSLYIMLFVEERYQQAGCVTRLTRRLVFTPKRFIQFLWWITCWAACGLKPLEYPAVVEDECPGIKFTRAETLEHFWTISRSMCHYDMQWYYLIDELKQRLSERHEAAETTAN